MLDKNASILVVDDSVVQRQHAMALLRELGVASLYEAGNGQEALDLLAMLKLPPAIIVLDLEMPGMDGVELMQQMQQRHILIPVVVVSSREESLLSSVETMVKNTNMRVLGVIQKPLDAKKMADMMTAYSDTTAIEVKNKSALPPLTESELAEAIADKAIVAYYQPKVDMRTGILKGVEALARLQHATLGFVSPDRFIPVAEQTGLIHALTFVMLEQAMAQAVVWNTRGLTLKVAVNLSALSLDMPNFVPDIIAMQERYGLPADQLVFEITESSVVSNLGNALGMLARLRLKGFGLSIDDYGTGFSSMQQLAMIPFTELKIDRSFVHGAHEKQNLRVILQSALDMAQRLDLVSVAEGIENIKDWRLLQESGCVIGQGFLIGKPMQANDLPVWLKEHHRRLPELRAPTV